MASGGAEESHRGDGKLTTALVAALVIFMISLLMVVMALDFGREARRLPLIVGVPLLLMAGINLVNEISRRRRGDPAAEERDEDDSDGGFVLNADELMRRTQVGSAGDRVVEGLSLTAALTILAMLVALYVLLGQVASTPVFIVLAMRLFNKRPWRQVLATAVIMTVLMYCMTAIVQLPSYAGVLPTYWPWLGEVLR